MSKLLAKEMRLSASKLSYIFIVFTLMAFIPQYPILVGAFFVCFGIFHSFQTARESNDIVYSSLLPIAKRDVVRGKFAFTLVIQGMAFAVSIAFVAIRMLVVGDAGPYGFNAMMNANLAYLGYMLIIFGLFNLVFIAGFFKTAYKFGGAFVIYIVITTIIVSLAEVLHHIPGLEALNSNAYDPLQLIALIAGIVLFAVMTFAGLKLSEKRFERVDL